jgi:hypothetical protein
VIFFQDFDVNPYLKDFQECYRKPENFSKLWKFKITSLNLPQEKRGSILEFFNKKIKSFEKVWSKNECCLYGNIELLEFS